MANAEVGPICADLGSTHQGAYVVMNNKWNPEATERQCIEVTANGYRLAEQSNTLPNNHFPAGYPSIYVGCHYTNCSDNSPFPKKLSAITGITSRITYEFTPGVYNASYDIWLDPTPKTDGVNQTEIMIWFNRSGAIQPVGAPTGTADIGGHRWEVWTGNNGGNNVVTYLGDAAIEQGDFDTMDYIRDAITRGPDYGTMDWYVTSIQAGFEPWSGGVDLAITSFDVAVK